MNQQTINTAKWAIRASRHKVGIKELPILLLSRDGVTADQLAKILKVDKHVAKGRVAMLLSKKLIVRTTKIYQQPAIYRPTESGMRIVEDIFGENAGADGRGATV